MSGHRLERVASVISQVIGEMILRQEIKDPRVTTMVSLAEVTVSRDLGHARISVAGYMNDSQLDGAVEALNAAAGYIQAKLGKQLKTRLTPKLVFSANHNLKDAWELTKKMEELVRDIAPEPAPGGDAPSQ